MNKNNNTENMIDLKGVFFSLLAQWKLILLCGLLSLIVVLLYIRTAAPSYKVDAIVRSRKVEGISCFIRQPVKYY